MTTDKLETGGPAFSQFRFNEFEEPCVTGGMTTRTYAAIHLSVPQSEHEFINDMIREQQRFELAKAAMACLLDRGSLDRKDGKAVALASLEMADAMLAEQEKK